MARILILAGDGTVCDHLDYAYFRMLEQGLNVTIAAPEKKPLQTTVHQGEPGRPPYHERLGYIMPVHAAFDEIDPSTYDALILPGGRAPEYLRNDHRCVNLVRHFVTANKPIAANCHGPHLLLAAGVTGRRMTATDDIELEVRDAGNIFVEATGQPDHVRDGNIVTVWRKGVDHAWIREFLNMLEARGITPPRTASPNKARVLVIAGDFTSGGQMRYAVNRMREEAFEVTLAAPEKHRVNTAIDMREEGWKEDVERLGFWAMADAGFDQIDPSGFDALIVLGWRSAEYLRNNPACRRVVAHFLDSDKPIGAICQAPRILVAAGARGRRMTGLEMIKPEIARANTYVDAGGEAVIDRNIVTVSRRPYYHVWMRAFLALLRERMAVSERAA